MAITGIEIILGLLILGRLAYLYNEYRITPRFACVSGGLVSVWVVAAFAYFLHLGSTT